MDFLTALGIGLVFVVILALLAFIVWIARMDDPPEVRSLSRGGCVSPRAPQKPTDPDAEKPADH